MNVRAALASLPVLALSTASLAGPALVPAAEPICMGQMDEVTGVCRETNVRPGRNSRIAIQCDQHDGAQWPLGLQDARLRTYTVEVEVNRYGIIEIYAPHGPLLAAVDTRGALPTRLWLGDYGGGLEDDIGIETDDGSLWVVTTVWDPR